MALVIFQYLYHDIEKVYSISNNDHFLVLKMERALRQQQEA